MARGKVRVGVLSLAAAAAACSGPEKTVVDNYFNAVRHKDNQTLASFAAVSFDRPVQSWKIVKAHVEESGAMALPALVGKAQELEKAVADNKKTAQSYSFDHISEVDQVRELRKAGKPVPAKLAAVAAEWDKYNVKDRDLKRQLAQARDAVEKEKRNLRLSVGDQDDLESLQGEVRTKRVDLDLTIDGQAQPYVMTLRKYDVKREGAAAPPSRWVVQGLAPRQG